jgi:hypothetical protein
MSSSSHKVLQEFAVSAQDSKYVSNLYTYAYHKNIPLEDYVNFSVIIWPLSLQMLTDI